MSAINIQNLSVITGTKRRLNDVSLDIPMGACVAIIGPNGAGKSTLLQSLLGLVDAVYQEGSVLGEPLKMFSRKKLAYLISYVAQHQESTPNISVYEWCEMARFPYQKWGFSLNAYDKSLIAEILKQTETLEFKDRLLSALSGGELQRVYIAGALCQETPLIFLDEPSNFLDPKHVHEVMAIIARVCAERQKTILCVTHDINQVTRYFTHCLAIKSGEILFFGKVDEVITEANLNRLYDYVFTRIGDNGQEFFW